MSDDIWEEMNPEIAKQLALQDKLFWKRDHGFMLRHGLKDCKVIVDLGTGRGGSARKLAWKYPDIQFYGIDKRSSMTSWALSQTALGTGSPSSTTDLPNLVSMINLVSMVRGALAIPNDPPNLAWVLADATDPNDKGLEEILSLADGVLMRYFVLHLEDTKKTLPPLLNKVVKPGAHIWVTDIDPEHSRSIPRVDAYDSFIECVQSFCEATKVEIRIASKLPEIFKAAGFEVDAPYRRPFRNYGTNARYFSEYIRREIRLYNEHQDRKFTDAVEKIEKLFSENMDPKVLLEYGMTNLHARRPNSETNITKPVLAAI